MLLNFRPHHFLCALGFQGKGYSPAFVENFTRINKKLNDSMSEQITLRVTFQADAICQPCPHRRESLCRSQLKIDSLDQRNAQALTLKEGDQLTWVQAKNLIKNRIDLETFHEICQGCEWKDWGVCADALNKLYQET